MKQNVYQENVRSFFIFCCIMSCYGIIIFNLYKIQITQQDFFKNLGEKQYNITTTTLPERAYIYDRNGTPIAVNKMSYAAFLLPKQIVHYDAVVKFLEQHFPTSCARLTQAHDKNFFFIARKLTDDQLRIIQDAKIPDIHILEEPSRFYPYPTLSTVLGITDIDNHGIMGIEQQYDEQLQGTPTIHTLKKDARSDRFYFEKELTHQGNPSEPVTLTIDAQLQYKITTMLEKAVEELQAKEAAVVVMDPQTGAISAMASYPYFDPNHTENLDMQTTKNRPATQAFECGSVIKTFCALAALDLQVVTLEEMINCENTKETKVDGIRVRTIQPHGTIPYQEVVQFSNNIGTVKVAKRVGAKLYDYYSMLGFGQFTGLNFPGEQKGYVNHPKNWSAYSIVSLSFGYEITTTLVQLIRALSVIYNGGQLITPHITKKLPENMYKKLPIQEKTLQDIHTILEGCVHFGSGKRAGISGYTITGKTGTANILENGVYNEDKHLNTFIGYVNKDHYHQVIGVYVRESKKAAYSSIITAPIFKKAAEILLIHDHIV
jgi:cell division protein FtsI (penicillin-binding protein 3)